MKPEDLQIFSWGAVASYPDQGDHHSEFLLNNIYHHEQVVKVATAALDMEAEEVTVVGKGQFFVMWCNTTIPLFWYSCTLF